MTMTRIVRLSRKGNQGVVNWQGRFHLDRPTSTTQRDAANLLWCTCVYTCRGIFGERNYRQYTARTPTSVHGSLMS